ncbi:MAG: hypothetical protein A2Y17_02990 [Clostridiales bacterium GWF2_38_85]|nr:MAG: hypothetical protein A2Y17_02990 [Clostridiales bacterium GWF2_38_85]
MISKALLALATDIGFNIADDCVFGEYQGYMISLYEKGNRKIAFINYYLMDNEGDALKKFRLSESVKADILSFGIKEFEIEDNGVTIEIVDTVTKLLEYINAMIEKLTSEEIAGVKVCSECGKPLEDKYKKVSINLNRYALCDSCTLDLIQNSKKENNEKHKEIISGKIGLGILGGIIGLLLGIFVWNLIAYLGIVSMWAGFLLAMFIYFGYVLFKGRKGKLRLIITSILSIFGVIICSFTSQIIMYLVTNNQIAYFMNAPSSFIEIAIENSDFTMPIIIGLLCAAFSILIFASDILKEKAKTDIIKID